LKALKSDLSKWNVEMFGNVGKKNKDLMDGNRELDFTVEGQPLLREKG
jgi:hypothetical protein